MKFKKMFSIVLMTLLCFNAMSTKVFADDVRTENIAYEGCVAQTYAKETRTEKTQLESSVTKDAVRKVTNAVGGSLSAKTCSANIVTSKATKVSAMPLAASKAKTKTYNAADLRLLSAIIYCEAQGETYAGKVAVGIVVMNRKASKQFPNSIKGVVYQKNQFQPVRNGSLNKALKKYDQGKFKSGAGKQCVKAAKEALDGTKKVSYKSKTINLKGYHFFSRYLKGCRVQIGNHQFK